MKTAEIETGEINECLHCKVVSYLVTCLIFEHHKNENFLDRKKFRVRRLTFFHDDINDIITKRKLFLESSDGEI